MELANKQRSYLRALAHQLKPILHVGKEGATETVVRSVTDAFNTRELIKIRVLDTAPEEAAVIADRLVAGVENLHCVQVIGHTIVLYRPHPKKPELKLPAPKLKAAS